jgi:EAL and modified HD-GYP domain-containing signal transduction protein
MDLFLARQPIFTPKQRVYGYQLLFRPGTGAAGPELDPTQAAARVLVESLCTLGLEGLTGGRYAFIALTRELLLGEYATLLPKEHTVIEVRAEGTPDAKVVAACARLKAAGYRLALDNFVQTPGMAGLVALADLLKVDFRTTPPAERRALVSRHAASEVRLVAAEVETPESFREAVALGYSYFQGFFFAKPAAVPAKATPEFRLTYLTLLQEVGKASVDFRAVAALISRDVTLSYKLLRYINSAFFGLRRTISTIPEALTLLGERELKRWASLLSLAALASRKPAELVVEAALRARFCEALADDIGLGPRREELFLLGLFSLLDALLDRPLPDLLKELPIPATVTAALLGERGPLRDVYECVRTYMQGDWDHLSARLDALGLGEEEVPRRYREALAWVQQALPAEPRDSGS